MRKQADPRERRRPVVLLMVGLALLMSGCTWHTRPPDVYQAELHRSAPQILQLINNYAGPIVVRSNQSDRMLRLGPGDVREIEFLVITLADMALSDASPWYVFQDTRVNFAQERDDMHYLKPSGTDLMLDIAMADGLSDSLRLSLQNCPLQGWEDAPAATLIHSVTFPGLTGIPQRICPQ